MWFLLVTTFLPILCFKHDWELVVTCTLMSWSQCLKRWEQRKCQVETFLYHAIEVFSNRREFFAGYWIFSCLLHEIMLRKHISHLWSNISVNSWELNIFHYVSIQIKCRDCYLWAGQPGRDRDFFPSSLHPDDFWYPSSSKVKNG
jgi:hypothetical protein